MVRFLMRAAAIVLVLGTACGSPRPTPVANANISPPAASPSPATPSPVASAEPTSTPSAIATPSVAAMACKPAVFSPEAGTNRRLALVNLAGVEGYVVRDITDLSHPFTVANFGIGISAPRFVNSREVSYAVDCGFARSPLTGSPTIQVPTSAGSVSFAFDWTADGTTLIYLSDTRSGSGLALHEVRGGTDRVLASGLPSIPAVGCESQFCAEDALYFQFTYSPDDATISLVESVAGTKLFRLWTYDGRVLDNSDSKSRLMSTWSGTGFYFRDSSGVEVWRNGAVSPFLPGVAWSSPASSPDGGRIAYTTKDAAGFSHVWIVETAAGTTHEIKLARSGPKFLSGRYLWYAGQRACVAADYCPSGWTAVSSGKTYVYDLQTGTESESVITNVYDVWPHAA
jgi:hypothetical protein